MIVGGQRAERAMNAIWMLLLAASQYFWQEISDGQIKCFKILMCRISLGGAEIDASN